VGSTPTFATTPALKGFLPQALSAADCSLNRAASRLRRRGVCRRIGPVPSRPRSGPAAISAHPAS